MKYQWINGLLHMHAHVVASAVYASAYHSVWALTISHLTMDIHPVFINRFMFRA